MLQLSETGAISADGTESMSGIDAGFLQSIMSRLEALEKTPQTPSTSVTQSSNNPEFALMKQQLETVKQAVIQMKNVSAGIKSQLDCLKNDVAEAKEIMTTIQNITMGQ
jgi:septation ring formation regulator EzrA